MKRINVLYAGRDYSVGERDLEDLKTEIAAGIGSGNVYWLNVNEGAGIPQPTLLALTVGTPIALTPIPEADSNPDSD